MILLVVDMQKGLVTDDLYAFDTFMERVVRIIDAARKQHTEVIYVQHDAGPGSGMSAGDSDAIAMKRWVNFLREQGNTEQEIQMQIDRRGVETFPITAEQHLDLLKRTGFRSADLLWASYLQAGFMAIK